METEMDEQLSGLIVIGMALCYLLYALVVVVGVPFNLYVLLRMLAFYRASPEAYRNGTGLCLTCLAVADLVSLLGICVHVCVISVDFSLSWVYHYALCKCVIFGMHLSTSLSIYSWFIMSLLRFLAVAHPYLHFRLWRFPSRVLLFAFAGSTITNIPLLLMAAPDENSTGCTLVPLSSHWPIGLNRLLLCVEIIWSFIVPTLVIVFMDTSVFLCGQRLASARSQSIAAATVANARKLRPSRSVLWRWMIIALVDVGLNAPENIFRLGIITGLVDPNSLSASYYPLARMASQVLYYSQFAFNGFYLALCVYDKSTRSTRNSLDSRSEKRRTTVRRTRSTDT